MVGFALVQDAKQCRGKQICGLQCERNKWCSSTDTRTQQEHGRGPHREGELVVHPPHQAGFDGAVCHPAMAR